MFIKIKNNQIDIEFTAKYKFFTDDNYYTSNSNYSVCSEGYYLDSYPKYEDILYLDYKKFTEKYKGRFAFAYLNKSNNELKVFNDLLSKKFIFYYNSDNLSVIATSFFDIIKYLKSEKIKLNIDNKGVNNILYKGSFEDDNTYVHEVKFLRAYEFLEYNEKLCVKKIDYPKAIENISVDEARDKAYKLFEVAMNKAIDKNNANKRSHIASMSGGMDTRAVFMQLMNKNIKDLTTYTYAQSGSKDQLISKQITDDYNIPNVFYSLDNSSFIFDRENLINQNEGQMYYCGSTGMFDCLKMVDTSRAGLIYMGVGGGEILGDINKVEFEASRGEFPKANYAINLNDIRQCQNSVITASKYSEFFSPFLYEDFFEYVMSLPFSIKQNRLLYVEIFNKYMYNFYDTTAFRGKIGNKRSFISKVLKHIKLKMFKKDAYSMNPFEYWWSKNKAVKQYIVNTFNSDISRLNEIGYDTKELISVFNGDVLAKLRALTASYMLIKILGE